MLHSFEKFASSAVGVRRCGHRGSRVVVVVGRTSRPWPCPVGLFLFWSETTDTSQVDPQPRPQMAKCVPKESSRVMGCGESWAPGLGTVRLSPGK